MKKWILNLGWKFEVSCHNTGDIFSKSGFPGIFAIPMGISGFVFSTASNWENPTQMGKVGMYAIMHGSVI
jgi:hypothetical protein